MLRGRRKPPPAALRRGGLEVEGAGIDAVPLPGRTGAVREDVPEMAAAGGTGDLGANHPVARIVMRVDALERHRLDEARPTRARVELRVGPEQLRPAAGAAVHAGRLRVGIRAGEGALGALLAQYVVLVRAEAAAPLGLGEVCLLHANDS